MRCSPMKSVLGCVLGIWDVYSFENCSPSLLFWWSLAKEQLKLWIFKVAKHCGSHFQKTAPKDFVMLHIFLSNRGLEFAKLQNVFMVIR